MSKSIVGTEEIEDITMTPQELHVLSELDSRQYGFLILKSTENVKKRTLVMKAVKYLQLMVMQAQRQSLQYEHENNTNQTHFVKRISIDPKTWIKLGHFHLLLEDYKKALSAYQMFYKTQSANHWMEPTFLYGLGLVYFYFNAYQWHAPEKYSTVQRVRSSPWITDTITQMQHLRNGALKDFKRSRNPAKWDYYKQLRNFTTIESTSE